MQQGESSGSLEGTPAERATTTARKLGILSVGSGLGMLFAPSAMARAYALPFEPRLLRALGLRDVLIGGLLLAHDSARLGLNLRAAADAGDALLVASQLARRQGAPRGTSLRVAAAMALVWLSSRARAAAGS
jgi:hypothetical protein